VIAKVSKLLIWLLVAEREKKFIGTSVEIKLEFYAFPFINNSQCALESGAVNKQNDFRSL
jgi:hypothetical protein